MHHCNFVLLCFLALSQSESSVNVQPRERNHSKYLKERGLNARNRYQLRIQTENGEQTQRSAGRHYHPRLEGQREDR